MSFGRAIAIGAAVGLTALIGTAVSIVIAALLANRLCTSGWSPDGFRTHFQQTVTGLAMLGLLFIGVGVLAYTPYCYLRPHFSKLLIADCVFHALLAVISALAIAAIIFESDPRAFAFAFVLLFLGGLLGLATFRVLIRSGTRSFADH